MHRSTFSHIHPPVFIPVDYISNNEKEDHPFKASNFLGYRVPYTFSIPFFSSSFPIYIYIYIVFLFTFFFFHDWFPSTIFPYRLILLRASALPPLNYSLPSFYRILALVRSIFLFFPTCLNMNKIPIFPFSIFPMFVSFNTYF